MGSEPHVAAIPEFTEQIALCRVCHGCWKGEILKVFCCYRMFISSYSHILSMNSFYLLLLRIFDTSPSVSDLIIGYTMARPVLLSSFSMVTNGLQDTCAVADVLDLRFLGCI